MCETARPLRPLTVLLIEDDPQVRDLFCRWLRSWAGAAMRCVEADSLAAGVEALRPGGIDLIVLDYRIPGAQGTSGIRALQDVMPNDRAPVPIDVVSGALPHAEGLAAIQAGADDYLQKDPETMKDDLLDMVQRSWARSQYYHRLTQVTQELPPSG